MEGIIWALSNAYTDKYVEVAKDENEAYSLIDVNAKLGIPLTMTPICSEGASALNKIIEKELMDNLPGGILN